MLAAAARALLVGALAAVCVGAAAFLVALLVTGDALAAGDAARRVLLALGAVGLFVGAIGMVVRSEPREGSPRPLGLDWRVALIVAGAGVEVVACLLDLALFSL